jgi:ABC-type molybdate transport system permease subunit
MSSTVRRVVAVPLLLAGVVLGLLALRGWVQYTLGGANVYDIYQTLWYSIGMIVALVLGFFVAPSELAPDSADS